MMRRTSAGIVTALIAACGAQEPDQLATSEPIEVRITDFTPRRPALVTQPITVEFSRPLVGPSEVGIDVPAEDLLVISPTLLGRCRWIAQDTLRFIPETPFADGARYRVQVRRGVVGEGRVLRGQTAFDFATRMFTLASVEANARPDTNTARVVLEFTDAVRPAEASAAVSFRRDNGRIIPSRIITQTNARLVSFHLGPIGTNLIDVHVDGSLRALAGGRPLEKAIVRPIRLDAEPILTLDNVEAFQDVERLGLRVRLSRSVDAPSIRSSLKIRPEIPHTIVERHHGFDVLGAFRSGKAYTVSIAKGLRSIDGFVLPDRAEQSVTMPALAPALRLTRNGGPLELSSVNVARVDVRVTKVWDDNVAHIIPFLGGRATPEDTTFGPVVYRGALDTAGRANEVTTSVVPYEDSWPRRAGVYHVEVVDTERAFVRASAWVLDDGLKLTAKVGASLVRAEVISQSTLRPIYGATVRVVSRTNRTLGEARTAPSGVAEVLVDVDPEDPPAWVITRRGASFAYLPLGLTQTIPKRTHHGRVRGRAFVFSDRSVYRAGEVIQLGVLVRDDDLHPPTGPAPQLQILGPIGAALNATATGRTVDGASIYQVTIPADARQGRYEVRVVAEGRVVGTHTFWVERASPPRLVASVEHDTATTGPRAPGFIIEGRYRLGQKPAAGLVMRSRCRYTESLVEPPNFPSFVFGGGTTRPLELEEPEVESRLDDQGRGRRWCPAIRSTGATGPVRITLEAAIVEPGGRIVEDAATVVHQPMPHQIGVRRNPEVGPALVGQDAGLQVVVVGADQTSVAGVAMTATVRSLDGSAAAASMPIVSGDGAIDIPYTTHEPGRHRIDVESADGAKTSLLFWVVPDEGSAVAAPGGDLVIVGGASVELGDTSEFVVWAPFEGRLDLSVERDRVLWRSNVELSALVSRVRVPVLSSFAPNAYVVARLVNGRKTAYASAPLSIRTEANRLVVGVTAPTRATAGQSLPVTVTIADGGRANAIVWIVAEQRLEVASERPLDPFEHFVGQQPLSLTTHDLLALDQVAGSAPVATPLRDRAPNVEWSMTPSAWTSIVPIDGKATISIPMPFLHGGARIGVVAFANDRFGSATTRVDVTDPLRVRTSVPRFLRPGDQLSMPIEIENGLDRTVALDLGIRTSGPLTAASMARRVSIPKNAAKRLHVDVVVGKALGEGRITLGVSSKTSSTTIERHVSIRPSRSPEIVGVSQEVERATPMSLIVPSKFLAGGADASITIGPTPLFAHRAALDVLLGSTTDSARSAAYEVLALLYAGRLRPDGDVLLKDALARLVSSTGGRDEWAMTIYGLALFESARRRAIDPATSERTYQRIQAMVSASPNETPPMTLAVAQFVLALADRPDRRGLIALADQWEAADAPVEPHVRAILGAALMRAGMLTRGRRMLDDELPLSPGLEPLLLAVIADVQPFNRNVKGLMDSLRARAVSGHWDTPEQNALALVALAKVSRSAPSPTPYWGSVLVDNDPIRRFSVPRTLMFETPLDAWTKKPVAIEVTGAGTAYVGFSVRGVPSAPLPDASNGMNVARRLHTAAGKTFESAIPYGELVVGEVHVTCSTAPTCGRVVVEEQLPSGLEVEDPNLVGLEWFLRGARRARSSMNDDRLNYEVELDEGESAYVYYSARAVAAGTFVAPAVVATSAKDHALRAASGAGTLTVSLIE